MRDEAESANDVIVVKGICRLCGQQVWSNETRWKSRTHEGEEEEGYYVHKACHDARKIRPQESLEMPSPAAAQGGTLSRVHLALSEVDAGVALVSGGRAVTRFKKTLGFSRGVERFVAVCPQSATVYWTRTAKPDPLPSDMHCPTLAEWADKIGDCKRDKLVGAVPATSKHVANKHRERALVLVTETTELVLAVDSGEDQRAWLAGCHSILGRVHDAQLLAGVKAAEECRGQAELKLAGAKAMEAAAAAAKAQAAAQAEASAAESLAAAARVREKAEAEVLAAKERAAGAGAAARAAAAAAAATAKAVVEAELLAGKMQLDEVKRASGGEKMQLPEPRECVVCFEDFLGLDDGVQCLAAAASHFVCNGCFLASVQSAVTDSLAKQTMRHGKIACPYSTFPPSATSCRAECFADKTVAEKV